VHTTIYVRLRSVHGLYKTKDRVWHRHQKDFKTTFNSVYFNNSEQIIYILLYLTIVYTFVCKTQIRGTRIWREIDLGGHRFEWYMDSDYPFGIFNIARNDRWFAYLHIQNGGSKRIWNLTYSWTGKSPIISGYVEDIKGR
jgi:hypothetical protein